MTAKSTAIAGARKRAAREQNPVRVYVDSNGTYYVLDYPSTPPRLTNGPVAAVYCALVGWTGKIIDVHLDTRDTS